MNPEIHRGGNKAVGLLFSELSFIARQWRESRLLLAGGQGLPWGQRRGSGAAEGAVAESAHGTAIISQWVK